MLGALHDLHGSSWLILNPVPLGSSAPPTPHHPQQGFGSMSSPPLTRWLLREVGQRPPTFPAQPGSARVGQVARG